MSNEQLAMSKEKMPPRLLIFICSLLFALCSLASCPSPFSPSNTGEPWEDPQINPPSGKGAFTLSIRMSSTARTVLPKTPTLSDFDKFTFVFSPLTGSPLTENRSYSQLSAPFYLNPGTYTLEVSAFYTEDKLVAKGGISGISISTGKSTNRELSLKVITDTGPGTFAYNISFSLEGMELETIETAIMESATMKITPQKPEGTTLDVDLLTNGTGKIELDNGYYNVTFAFLLEVKKGETIHQTLALDWWEILHIYPHLESSFEQVFTIDYFYIDAYKVTFVCYNGGNDIIQSVLHGDTVKKLETDPTKTLCYFEGWYTGPNGTGTPFNFDKPIDKNTNIYAKWDTITYPLTDVKYIKPYLAGQTGGGLTTPVELKFNLGLGDMTNANSNWQQMLIKLDDEYNYVNLDLSLCNMNGTEFNPDSSVDTGKYKIVDITLPTAAQSIIAGISSNESAFKYFNNLRSVNGTGLRTIGNYAFYGCTSLTQTSLPSEITFIGNGTFSGCTNLALTSLPNGITTINEYTFYGCTKLALTSLPNITSIGNYAFQDCTSLNMTSLPATLISIGERAFFNCTGNFRLSSLPPGLTSIGSLAFRSCTQITLSSLPSGITTISEGTFNGCARLALTSLAGITSIGDSAFQNCTSLTQIELSMELTSIGDGAFSFCTNLTTVTSLNTTPPTAGITIFGTNGNISGLRIEVPESSLSAYQAAGNWSTYGTSSGNNRIFAIIADDGSLQHPFRIKTPNDLQKVGKDPTNGWGLDRHYILMDDINMVSQIWDPIGTYDLDDPYNIDDAFAGDFDGNNHSITNLSISKNEDFKGMFGAVTGYVKNLTLSCTITGGDSDYVGGIAGANVGTIENCHITGSISGSDWVGGVVGWNTALGPYLGVVENCNTNCTVSGDWYIGGVVGDNQYGKVENCYTTGNVNGNNYVGGVVGYNYSGSSVENCYATGTVSGIVNERSYIGGVVGCNSGAMKNCYATGLVGGSDYIGGVVGNNNSGTVEKCYATGEVSGNDEIGGVIGHNSGTVEKCYAIGIVRGNDKVGGVVGYNTGVGYNSGTVKNCYATGSVNGNNYVGGVVGKNTYTVENCYATGNVNGNDHIGGVLGGNEDAYNRGPVRNNVALNSIITRKTGASLNYGRVIGSYIVDDELVNNYGRSTMTGPSSYNWINSRTGKDGESIMDTQWNATNWWTTVNNWSGGAWDQSVWDIAANRLPRLNDMPAETQNPQNPTVVP